MDFNSIGIDFFMGSVLGCYRTAVNVMPPETCIRFFSCELVSHHLFEPMQRGCTCMYLSTISKDLRLLYFHNNSKEGCLMNFKAKMGFKQRLSKCKALLTIQPDFRVPTFRKPLQHTVFLCLCCGTCVL